MFEITEYEKALRVPFKVPCGVLDLHLEDGAGGCEVGPCFVHLVHKKKSSPVKTDANNAGIKIIGFADVLWGRKCIQHIC